jgi:anti-anti-sigma regulatory factor
LGQIGLARTLFYTRSTAPDAAQTARSGNPNSYTTGHEKERIMQSNMWTYEIAGDLVGIEALGLPGAMEGLEAVAGDILSLDMRQVRVMDASGLAAIIRIYSAMVHRGVTLQLERVRPELAQQLATLGLSDVFPTARPARRSLGLRLAQLVQLVGLF